MEDDIGNLSEEENTQIPRKQTNIPTNQNNSCFLDVLLMALFFNKHTFLDYCFLNSILKNETINTKFIFGTDSLLDLQKRNKIQNSLKKFVTSIRQPSDKNPNAYIAKLRLLISQCNFKSFKNILQQQDSMEFLYALVEILQLNSNFNTIKTSVIATNDLLHTIPKHFYEVVNRMESSSCIHSVFSLQETNLLETQIDSGIVKDGFRANSVIYQRQITTIQYIPTNAFFIIHIDRTLKKPGFIDKTAIALKETMFDFQLQSIGLHNGSNIKSGHYTCLIKSLTNQWLLYDDLNKMTSLGTFEDAVGKTNANQSCVFLLLTR